MALPLLAGPLRRLGLSTAFWGTAGLDPEFVARALMTVGFGTTGKLD